MPKKFSISILTYHNYPGVRTCVESILRNTNLQDIHLYLTDNGNPAGAGRYFDELQAKYPDMVTVIHNPENKGFIEPNNFVFAQTESPYLILVNDDVEIMEAGWLEKMESPFLKYPNASLVGPRGGCQTLTEDFHGRQHGPFEYLEGSLLAIKCDTRKPEPLFPNYVQFAYGEDSALSLEQRQKGYGLHQIELRFRHLRAQTSNRMHNIKQIQAKNHAALRKRWSHYLRVRKFDYPILVRRWAARGDVLLITPILRQIAAEHPLSPIYVETAFPELFRDNPLVVEASSKGKRGFDVRVVMLDMAYENKTETHVIDAYAEAAGVKVPEHKTDLYLRLDEIDWAKKRMKTQKWIALHAGPTTWTGKNWPTDRWNEISRYLKEEYKSKILLVGHNDGTPIVCDLDLRGIGTMHQSAAAIKQCQLFVGLDSFPMHLAQAVGTPTIGLFGVTNPDYLMTEGSPHIGLRGDTSIPESGKRHKIPGQVTIPSNGDAMRSITVEMAKEAAASLMAEAERKAEAEAAALKAQKEAVPA